MLVRVPKNTYYFKKYDGWYVTTSEYQALQWERGTRTPMEEQQIHYIGSDGTYQEDIWVWKKDEVNEFGPISP